MERPPFLPADISNIGKEFKKPQPTLETQHPSSHTVFSESEIPQIPTFEKLEKTSMIEKRFGEEIEMLIPRLYLSGESVSEVSSNVGLSVNTVFSWLDRTGIPRRKINDPSNVEKRAKGVRRIWEERREELLERVQSPEAKINRGNAIRNHYVKNPGKGNEVTEMARLKTLQRQKDDFGEDIREGLISLHTTQGLSIEEIAEMKNRSPIAIRRLFRKYEVPMRRKTYTLTPNS